MESATAHPVKRSRSILVRFSTTKTRTEMTASMKKDEKSLMASEVRSDFGKTRLYVNEYFPTAAYNLFRLARNKVKQLSHKYVR